MREGVAGGRQGNAPVQRQRRVQGGNGGGAGGASGQTQAEEEKEYDPMMQENELKFTQ